MFNTAPFVEKRKKDQPVLRMDIRFWLDGHFMGSKPAINAPPVARAYVKGADPSDPVRKIVFVKNGQEVFTADGFGPGAAEAEWKDNLALMFENPRPVQLEEDNEGEDVDFGALEGEADPGNGHSEWTPLTDLLLSAD